jgi:hypothetical protein
MQSVGGQHLDSMPNALDRLSCSTVINLMRGPPGPDPSGASPNADRRGSEDNTELEMK